MTVTDIKNPKKTSRWRGSDGPKMNQATPGQVATKLERLRHDNEYTKHEAAQAAGITYSVLNKLERGRYLPLSQRDTGRQQKYARAIAGLAVAYGVSVEDILMISEAEDNRVAA